MVSGNINTTVGMFSTSKSSQVALPHNQELIPIQNGHIFSIKEKEIFIPALGLLRHFL